MEFKGSKFLRNRATSESIRAYLLDVGVPSDILDTIDIYAYADETLTVNEVLPSLIEAYPQLTKYVSISSLAEMSEEQYIQDMINHIRRSLEMMIDESYNDEDKEMLIDEFGTLNPYIALLTVWASDTIPEEELFKLIEELPIDIDNLPKRLKRAYESWKSRELFPKSKPVNEKILKISRIAKDNQYLFYSDIEPEKLPVRVTKRNIPKRLPTILVLGTDENLAQLDRLTNEDYGVHRWVYWFPEAVEELKILHETVNTKNTALLGKIPDEDYWKLRQLFPNTMKELTKEIKALLPKPEKPKKPAKKPKLTEFIDHTGIDMIIPRPKKRRYTWMGMEIGVENLGMDLEVYGEIIKRQYRKRLSKYPPDIVEKAIKYVKRKFPHLDENSALFWQTVEFYVVNYVESGWSFFL